MVYDFLIVSSQKDIRNTELTVVIHTGIIMPYALFFPKINKVQIISHTFVETFWTLDDSKIKKKNQNRDEPAAVESWGQALTAAWNRCLRIVLTEKKHEVVRSFETVFSSKRLRNAFSYLHQLYFKSCPIRTIKMNEIGDAMLGPSPCKRCWRIRENTFYPFHPLIGRISRNPFLVSAYFKEKIRSPNFMFLVPGIWAGRWCVNQDFAFYQ